DYPRNRLVLRARSPKISAAFQAEAASAGATIVPCYLIGDHFVLAQAQVNDAPPGLFMFDSGLAGGGLMPSAGLVAAAKITVDRSKAQTGFGGGGAVTAVPFVAERVAVGTAVQQNVTGLYTPQGTPFGIFPFTVWGAISNDYLRNYAYTVDFEAMRIVLQARTPRP
ncbi:MAG TPA: aspartyl protease family protein, partial [Candidatus Nitrosotalea sp.]|nr:aspartyl protease family protein [Candidatus Nitrosotalea sp.]